MPLPIRRPSAPANHGSPGPSQTSTLRTHRSIESTSSSVDSDANTTKASSLNQGITGTSNSYEKKTVVTLMNRITLMLPCNSGKPMEMLEGRPDLGKRVKSCLSVAKDNLEYTTYMMVQLLEKLPTQPYQERYMTVEVLQSQLIVMKFLALVFATRWRTSEDEWPGSDQKKGVSQMEQPAPVGEDCAKYTVSVIAMYLRMAQNFNKFSDVSKLDTVFHYLDTSPISPVHAYETDRNGTRTEDSSSSLSSNSSPPRPSNNLAEDIWPENSMLLNTKYRLPTDTFHWVKTHISRVNTPAYLGAEISKYVARIIYFLSATNWKIVSERINSKLKLMSQSSDPNLDTSDLHFLIHSALDKSRLVSIMHGISSLFVGATQEMQAVVAWPLRCATWNWIQNFPEEFNHAIRGPRRMDSAPERVFDWLYERNVTSGHEDIWPALSMLNCISFERSGMSAANRSGVDVRTVNRTKKTIQQFSNDIIKSAATSPNVQVSEAALASLLEICLTGARIEPDGDSEAPLRLLAQDTAEEILQVIQICANGRPFWESDDEINLEVFADALVALYRFLPEDLSIPIYSTCLEPERSDAVKICVLVACRTLSIESPQIPWNRSISALRSVLSPRILRLVGATAAHRTEVDSQGNAKRPALRPRLRASAVELKPTEFMILAALRLWSLDPLFYLPALPSEDVTDYLWQILKLWDSSTDLMVQISLATQFKQQAEMLFTVSPENPMFDRIISYVTQMLPSVVLCLSRNLIHIRESLMAQQLWTSFLLEYLEFIVRPSSKDYVQAFQLSPAWAPALALCEINLLVSLVSSDSSISQLAGQGLGLIARAETRRDAPMVPGFSDENRARRNPVYVQIGDPSVKFIGRAFHQKRLRNILRQVSQPNPINIAVWLESYHRWNQLNGFVIPSELPAADPSQLFRGGSPFNTEDKFQSWRNLTLFLASFSSCCISDTHDSFALHQVIFAQLLPDTMAKLPDPGPLIDRFLRHITDHLVSTSAQIRDVAMEALGAELAPRLLIRFFNWFTEATRPIFAETTEKLSESMNLFLIQSISILKLIVERKDITTQDVTNIDIGPTLLSLFRVVCNFSPTASHVLRMKLCGLAATVCDRNSPFVLKRDAVERREILEIVMLWLSSQENATVQPNSTDSIDTKLTCMNAVVSILDRLELQPLTFNPGDDTTHEVSRLFIRYLSTLLDIYEIANIGRLRADTSDTPNGHHYKNVMAKYGELREQVIAATAHLISANSDSGLKHSLSLAYDEDFNKRVLFCQVFSRVLGKGTTFESREDGPHPSNTLLDLLRSPDMVLVIVLCEVCPATEVDVLVTSLLNIFDTRASLTRLLKFMIDREIANTDSPAALFRGNSTCTRFLSAFAKAHGYTYLRNLIQPLVQKIALLPNGYEIDPARAGDQDVAKNRENVKEATTILLNNIASSVPALPSLFREICAHIALSVYDEIQSIIFFHNLTHFDRHAVWPEAKFAALGSFIFLRFISPAIVAPENIDIDVPPNNTRRGLMYVAKVVQNLANNVRFGKEAHMVDLNDFLEKNIVILTRYLTEVYRVATASQDLEPEVWLAPQADDTDVLIINRFIVVHADKIGQELLQRPDGDAIGDVSGIGGPQTWRILCAALVDMEEPLEVPKLSNLSSSEHRDYQNLLRRFANRNTTVFNHVFVDASLSKDSPVFVLHMRAINVEELDVELFMCHIFKILAQPHVRGKNFDVVLDCSGFNSLSEIPVQWIKLCAEIVPGDIRQFFSTVYILCPNNLAIRYLRRIHNVTNGVQFASTVQVCSTTTELAQKISYNSASLAYLTQIEAETISEYEDLMVRPAQQMSMPAVIFIGPAHLRIVFRQQQSLAPSVVCKSTEIIPLQDVSDVYNVSTGNDSHEFILRRSRQGVTLYMSSPDREEIVKSIRTAVTNLKDAPTTTTDIFRRFSNVPATLLRVGMFNTDNENVEASMAACLLLEAVCKYLKYDNGIVIPSHAALLAGDSATFVVQLSEKMAEFAPQLTMDFIAEVCAGIDKANAVQRINSCLYMSPWIKNLPSFCNRSSKSYEASGARLRDCIRMLLDLTMLDQAMAALMQKCVWQEVAKLDSATNTVVVDELIRSAVDSLVESRRCALVARIIATLSSLNVRGKMLFKLRKALGRASLKPTRLLEHNTQWNEIATLTHLCFVVGHNPRQSLHTQFFLPDLIHLVSLISGTGQVIVRKSIYGLLYSYLQCLQASRVEETARSELSDLIEEYQSSETSRLFGLVKHAGSIEYSSFEPANDRMFVENQTKLMQLLMKVLAVTANSSGLLNIWRARWMSLMSSIAFQHCPAIQTRAFLAIGSLATADVDDDFMYQMLVALQTALQDTDESDTISIVCMLRCIAKVVPALTPGSKYPSHLVWLAIALIQSSHVALFEEAGKLLQASLMALRLQEGYKTDALFEALAKSRSIYDDILDQLDQLLGLSFKNYFSFSLVAILFKGVRHPGLAPTVEAVLRTLFEATCDESSDDSHGLILQPESVAFFLALLPYCASYKSYRSLLKNAGADIKAVMMTDVNSQPVVSADYLGVTNSEVALLVLSLVSVMVSTAQGNDVETEMLFALLGNIGQYQPDLLALIYEELQEKMNSAMSSSSDNTIMSSVCRISRLVNSHLHSRKRHLGASSSTLNDDSISRSSERPLVTVLEDLRMPGLANQLHFLPTDRGQATTIIQFIPELIAAIIGAE